MLFPPTESAPLPSPDQKRHQAGGRFMNPYFQIAIPAADDKSGQNKRRCGDNQNILKRARIHSQRRFNGRRGARRLRHDDGLLAHRAINLRPNNWCRTGYAVRIAGRRFEFSHKLDWPRERAVSDMTRGTAVYYIIFLKNFKCGNPAATISNSADLAASNLSSEKFRPCE